MVASVLRHLRSLRLLKRDGGYIHLLLEEAENERMHLMTFMKVGEPSLFFRLCVLGAQGIFTNLFFLCYMLSPKYCHRFVGKLEEEACLTYTLAIQEVEAGRLPEWENMPAPRIAIDYWRLKEDAKMLDVLYAVRSDEAGHRVSSSSRNRGQPLIHVFSLQTTRLQTCKTRISILWPLRSHLVPTREVTSASRARRA